MIRELKAGQLPPNTRQSAPDTHLHNLARHQFNHRAILPEQRRWGELRRSQGPVITADQTGSDSIWELSEILFINLQTGFHAGD